MEVLCAAYGQRKIKINIVEYNMLVVTEKEVARSWEEDVR